jgi:hypothetical protein
MIGIDYLYACMILVALLSVMIGGSFLMKRVQKKWQTQGEVTLEEGLLIDTKRRAVILNVKGQRFLYTMGPHNDHLISLTNSDHFMAHDTTKNDTLNNTLEIRRA